ncbi:MAG: Eco57I restriction-modification methylase domain-containing protein [Bacteroidales bacterium]|nr:Eco57I restriction-modification methylase domain-containing protein [Bacteroidales bacterium]
MNLNILKPRKALNKAFLKVKPNRNEIECFKENLIKLIDHINESESEEFHKNIVSTFLKDTYYKENHYINTKGRNDLVIHNGKDAKGTVGVIIETKKPTNKTEMLKTDNINTKAFQELVLYYLRERITGKNLDVKHLIATNIYEWFIFDAQLFDKLFAHNKTLVTQFNDFEENRLSVHKTDSFYKEIAEPYINDIKAEITFTHFDIRDFNSIIRNSNKQDDSKLIALYKLLSPEHLLKLPFVNDSNSLDKRFYSELLHIIGLTETKEGGKKLIERKKEGERNSGSLIENAIIQLDSLDKISRLEKPHRFGETNKERLFNVALELSITWINRILFLKLLEAQLISYHKGDKSFSFLNIERIKNYDDLNSLFFKALARKPDDREEGIKKAFAKIPYLNSSLFEPTEVEHAGLFISQLENNKLPILSSTVLKDVSGKKRTGEIDSLEYFFEFLDAYDFTSEGQEEIQEDNKTLINASVLGLIFEKINGYKDGSFFTPGFITMYMCRETIRRAIVQKFNETKGWDCTDINELYNKIEDRKEANQIINSLKICDPAVGSGHFLVSALNEIIAIKSELKVLLDRTGKRLKEYHVEVENDELIITDEDGEFFEYNPRNTESQRVQETFFNEKQTIIESCLFGVDINPNSVKICRLRLWIELLKNAYYTESGELETLPNIDINIKCGNSLISRYDLNSDIRKALRNSKWNIDTYRLAVSTYRNAKTKEEKRGMEDLILKIKQEFSWEIRRNDPLKTRIDKLTHELYNRFTGNFLFESASTYGKKDKKLEKLKKAEQSELENEITTLTKKMNEVKDSKIFDNAFEWRFEFPDVLNDDGDFVGFDVVIGNPPYGVRLDQNIKNHLNKLYPVVPDFEIYLYFIANSLKLINTGQLCFIQPNTFMAIVNGKKFREYILTHSKITEIVDLSNNTIFEDANVRTCILALNSIDNKIALKVFSENKFLIKQSVTPKFLSENNDNWLTLFSTDEVLNPIIQKIRKHEQLSFYCDIIRGYIAYRRSDLIKFHGTLEGNLIIDQKLWHSITKKDESYYPEIMGRDLFKYYYVSRNLYIKYGKHLASYVDLRFYKNPHIAVREIAEKSLICSFVDAEIISSSSTHLIIPNDSCLIDLKVFLSILNSKLIGWYHYNTSPKAKKGMFPKILVDDLNKIPIPNFSDDYISTSTFLVNNILERKKNNINSDISDLETKIDQLVYQLYGLTDEEIKIIEKS